MENLKKDKKSKLIIPVAVISILVIAIAVTLYSNKRKIEARANAVPREASAIPVKIASVELKAVDDNIELTGSFEARQTLPLIAEAQGSIIQLNIHEGQSISAGQIVAQIDPTSLQASLASAQATYNNAIKNKERYERLAEAGAISQKQYEDVALSVEKARTDMKNIQQQMKYTNIHSPMSGFVSKVKVEQGSFASPGMELGSVVDISKLKMVVRVDEQDVIKLKKGQPVSIKTEVYPDHLFSGTISLISVQADAGRKYDVEVEVPNSKECPLKAGMFGIAKFNTANKENSKKLFIPRQAIVGSIQNAKVFVLNNDSTVSLKNIEVQNQSGDRLVVLHGLNAAEKVVTSGQINLQTGTRVRVVE